MALQQPHVFVDAEQADICFAHGRCRKGGKRFGIQGKLARMLCGGLLRRCARGNEIRLVIEQNPCPFFQKAAVDDALQEDRLIRIRAEQVPRAHAVIEFEFTAHRFGCKQAPAKRGGKKRRDVRGPDGFRFLRTQHALLPQPHDFPATSSCA